MTVKGRSGGAMGEQWRGYDNGDDGGSGGIGSGVGGIKALGGGDT